ncbi:MAG: BON domain-containing protein [Proteobacteria bacterium]|nr:BON domain-containing protein [Pseudomonadota bacterium]
MAAPRRTPARLLCLLLIFTASCATSGPQAPLSAEQARSVADAVHQRRVAENDLEIADIGVAVDSDGTAHLTGRTYTQAKADRAVQIARTTAGVSRVRNEIQSLPSTPR